MKLADDPYTWERKKGVYVPALNVVPSVEGGIFSVVGEEKSYRPGRMVHLGGLALIFGISEEDMQLPTNGGVDILARIVRFTNPGTWEILTEGEMINMYSQTRVPITNSVLQEFAPYPTRLEQVSN